MGTTLLYYTANLISEGFAERIRGHLLGVAGDFPIVSVSQAPLDFGRNVCVGSIGASTYNTYRQILIGAEAAETEFVACCEDDSLYTREHLEFRPSDDGAFHYNVNRWNVDRSGIYFHRTRAGMCMCVCRREALVEVLRKRFEKFPVHLSREEAAGWAEPGRKERQLGLPKVRMETFRTEIPTLTFNHRPSVGGLRKILPKDVVVEELFHWGKASDLWREMHG